MVSQTAVVSPGVSTIWLAVIGVLAASLVLVCIAVLVLVFYFKRKLHEVEVRREQTVTEQREQQQSFLQRMMRAILSVRRAQVQINLGAPGAQPTSSVQTPEMAWLARQEKNFQTTAEADALAAADDKLTTQQLEAQINDLRTEYI